MSWHIDAARADLMVWMPISNDRNDTPVSFKANAKTLIQRQQVYGDVLVVLPCQPDYVALGGTEANWKAICTVLYELADELDFPILDLTWAWEDFASSNALGLFADSIHENDTGLELIAGSLLHPLTIS
jgi:lysophospholipase L1-like esterase